MTQEVAITAADIVTIDDGIEWARALNGSADAGEIGGALITLNADVLNDPDNAGTKVDDLNAVIDDLEASIEKGPTP